MALSNVQFQTLSEFLRAPFGQNDRSRNTEYDSKYQSFITGNKIQVVGYTKVEESCFIHIHVPSETNTSMKYDVIIQFFTDNPNIQKESSYSNYYIKFFSNSPSFMYKFASLYKMHGYLIEELYDKLDSKFIDALPEKANPDLKINYDKSIYFACRYLVDNRLGILSKLGLLLRTKKTFDRFVKGISSFEDIKVESEIKTLERSIKTEQTRIKNKETKASSSSSGKRLSGKSTNQDNTSIHYTKKTTSKKPTSSTSSGGSNVTSVKRVTAKRSTTKK